jgi:chromosome segregation ATPase
VRQQIVQNKTVSKVIATLLIVSTVFAVTVSSTCAMVWAQPATLDDVLAELDALNTKLDALEANVTATNVAIDSLNETITEIESTLNYFSGVTVTVAELGTIISALEDLNYLTTELHSNLVSGNETVTTESITQIQTTVQEIRSTLTDLEASYSSSVPEDLNTQIQDMHFLIQILTVLVVVAVGLALIAAFSSIKLVKRVKQLNTESA